MRRVVVSTYVSLDGLMEDAAPDPAQRVAWSGAYWSDDAQRFAREQLFASDALLLGRTTYEGFAAAWPTEEHIEMEGDFALRMNSLPKYVASRTLEEPLEWNNSSLLNGDVGDAVAALKDEPGQDILMYSSVQLMHSLMERDLIDEYRLWLHPVILGSGRRLFKDGIDKTGLALVDSTSLPNGLLVLAYQPAAG